MTGHKRALHPAEQKYVLSAAQGLTAAETARKYDVSVHTVNTALASAKATLGARTIAHAVALALVHGDIAHGDVKKGSS